MDRRRVVVTGLGALTPVGNTADELWTALTQARSGVGPITKFDAAVKNAQGRDRYATRSGVGPITKFDAAVKSGLIENHGAKMEARSDASPLTQFVIWLKEARRLD